MWIQMQTLTKRNILYWLQPFLHVLLHITINLMVAKAKEFLKVLVDPGHLEVASRVRSTGIVLPNFALSSCQQPSKAVPDTRPHLLSGKILLQTLRQQWRYLKLLQICQGPGQN